MDGIVTHVYCEQLANLQLGLDHSPGINARVYVVIHCDGVGTEKRVNHRDMCIYSNTTHPSPGVDHIGSRHVVIRQML
jgi:hypothetical protein